MPSKDVNIDELASITRQWSPMEKNIDENFRENWRKWNPIQPPVRNSGSVVNRFVDAWNTSDFETITQLTTYTTVHHTRYSDLKPGGLRLVRNLLDTILPDFQVTVNEVREEGELVVVQVSAHGTHTGQLLGISPSHKEVSFNATEIFRVVDGVITEHWWGVYNGLGALVDEDGLNPVIGLIFAC